MADMSGQVVMVTGATNGIGEVTARELARMGATVIVVGRNPDKAQRVVSEIRTATGSNSVEYMIADLALMSEVRRLAETFQARYDRLHVLVNNAGMMFTEREITEEGYERTFALNHLNYFLLTNLLLDTIKATGTGQARARIINVSSGAHKAPAELRQPG
jgi:NAD(P)-dependent dehydrogenase (short-subunit alcohol dehydrogenase family)